ncbi:hypothetical protein [Siminovitchia terrae]|uniref:hypothetical protein n=1 Tax=Siminovitchia terrae TaxID=1914933 RepID=UPI001BB3D622|nr:hypothetical protein [Siminovitchia terrae]
MVFHSAGGKSRLNKVKASRGCHRFSEEIYRADLDKIRAQIRQGVFDISGFLHNRACFWKIAIYECLVLFLL